ncbi:MAG: hypothetical protein IPH13_20405 [Planctomycetes bacterium]|nr:hypothetical protein [Planctomycetota bacterium]
MPALIVGEFDAFGAGQGAVYWDGFGGEADNGWSRIEEYPSGDSFANVFGDGHGGAVARSYLCLL